MEKKIAYIRYKMVTVITLIAALGTWQHTFIIEGVMAHVEMNMTILGTFAFSIILAFIFVFKLRNEVVAFNALREMSDDIQHEHAGREDDQLWKFRRCATPAKIFQRPRLLGHAYELVTGELARTKKIKISVETMNTLVHTIEQSISDEKSMIVYLSGLLVFMGLIGTFIGLLHMVGAIGGIIGSLAQSAGGAGATGAFQELLAALQEPLKGMAAGFASSLFGLFSSLVVGLLGRFAGQAAGVLKGEFEAWLATVVQFSETEQDQNEGVPSAVAGPAPDNASLIRMVGNILSDYGHLADSFNHVTRHLQEMRTTLDGQSRTTEQLVKEFAIVHETQSRMLREIATTSQIAPALRDFSINLNTFGGTVTRRIEFDVNALREALGDISRTQASALRIVAANQSQTAAQIAGAIEQLSADIERRSNDSPSPVLETLIERSWSSGLGALSKIIADDRAQQEARMSKRDAEQDRIFLELGRLADVRNNGGDNEKLAKSIESAMTDGFERISSNVGTAFNAYSGLLHVAVAALERSETTHQSAQNAKMESSPISAAEHGSDASELHRVAEELRRRTGLGRSS